MILFFLYRSSAHRHLHSFPTRRSSDLYGYQRPDGGFCVWLDVTERGGDEDVTVRLYRDAGVRVVPGSYLARPQADGDRKSTRLNSSHGYISYAVFCLKKKNKAQVLIAL